MYSINIYNLYPRKQSFVWKDIKKRKKNKREKYYSRVLIYFLKRNQTFLDRNTGSVYIVENIKIKIKIKQKRNVEIVTIF